MHYIYITTNLIDGKCYIGQRKTPLNKTPYNDVYLGSGTRLLYAIKKYGKNNFKKEILHICYSQEEADKLEIQEITNRKALNNKDKFYNISGGGQFGRSENHAELTSKAMKDFYSTDKGKEVIKERILKIKIDRDIQIVNDYGSLTAYNIIKQLHSKRKNIKRINIKIKSNVNKINVEKLHDIDAWRDRINNESAIRLSKGRTDSANNKKQNGISYFKEDTKRKFAIAKAITSNNKVMIFLFDKGVDELRTIGSKIKSVCNKEYTVYPDNFYNQIKCIVEHCNKTSNEVINERELIDVVNTMRTRKNLNVMR